MIYKLRLTWCTFLFYYFFLPVAHSQVEHYALQYLTKEDGLSNSEITSIVQDRRGFIWVGTKDGLNRYDGYSVKVYRNIPGDSSSLCDNNITTLFVDSEGSLWIGTESNGLSIYNRNQDNFVNHYHRLSDPHSLSFSFVTSIEEDSKGEIWVGTVMGLNKYQKQQKNFKRYFREFTITIEKYTLDSLRAHHFPSGLISPLARIKEIKKPYEEFLSELNKQINIVPYLDDVLRYAHLENKGFKVKVLEADDQNNLWIGLERDGLYKLNIKNDSLEYINADPGNSNSLSSNMILSLCWDKNQLWIGTIDGGVNRFNPTTGAFSHYEKNFESKFIKCIVRGSKGQIWVGDMQGLSLYNAQSNTFYRFQPQYDDNKWLLSSDVSSLHEDIQGNLWVASYQGGINLLKRSKPFKQYKFYENATSGPIPKTVSATLEDSRGNLWVGYFTSGIDLFSENNTKKTFFKPNPSHPKGLGAGTVHCIFEDSNKNIWVGTYEGGLQRYDPKTNGFISYEFDGGGKKNLKDVRSICEDANGNLWIAVHGDGVKKYDPIANTFSNYEANYLNWENALSSEWVYTVFCDRKGRIWAGSVSGISMLDPAVGHFITLNKRNSNLTHNNVRVIREDHKGQIWIGTENGLNLFNEEERNFIIYTKEQGLPNNFVKGILEDPSGFLWISTNGGLTKCDFGRGTVKNYCDYDGLQSNEFFVGAYGLGSSGRMFFGGKNGLNSFYPESIRDNPFKPNVIITDLKLFNKSVPISKEEGGLLTKHISETKKITLSYDQNVLSFEFTAINYINPTRNSYAYILDGFEKEWNFVGNKREATYTNLDPGIYTFRVKAANNDGVWNEVGTSLQITINPPFWKTPWAMIFYILILILSLYLWRRAVLERMRVASRIEMDDMKLRFFANISHEFRTPLTLILGPLNTLSSSDEPLSSNQRELFNMMHRNGERLLRLINQLLHINELDAGFMKLKVREADAVDFCKKIIEAFHYNAVKRNIYYHFFSNTANALGYFDGDKLEKILFNLISNAFKYTKDHGSIVVDFSLIKGEETKDIPKHLLKGKMSDIQFVKITVEDTGRGIPAQYHEQIFDRFFRLEHKNQQEEGTGIGLSLARQLARIHYGDISLKSTIDKGSTFTVWFPINKERFKSEEIGIESLKSEDESNIEDFSQVKEKDTSEAMSNKDHLPILLIIDDSEDVRSYIRYNLRSEFQIEEAENGEVGVKKAFDIIPDIIISDVMMPVMNGFDLSQKLKKDQRTSHIPIILLTARTEESYQLKGLEEGSADDYITKPFNITILSAKTKNIIEQREKLKKKLQLEFKVRPAEVNIVSSDDIFIKNCMEIVEKYMSDSDFDVNVLGKEIGMSQTNLYRKLQALLGISANQFIKDVRLKRAAQLLTAGRYSVTDIAYMVGFGDPKYFSKSFKKHFGLLPTDYVALNTISEKEVADNTEI